MLSQCPMIYPLKTSENNKVFLSLQEAKYSSLAYNGVTTSDKFLTHIGPILYFLHLENFRNTQLFKNETFASETIWIKATMFIQI